MLLRMDDDDACVQEVDNVATDPANAGIIAALTIQLQLQYSYDRAWLTQRMRQMANGQGNQALQDGYIVRPPPPPNGGGGDGDQREL
jgi:hypothetical protein